VRLKEKKNAARKNMRDRRKAISQWVGHISKNAAVRRKGKITDHGGESQSLRSRGGKEETQEKREAIKRRRSSRAEKGSEDALGPERAMKA